MNSRFQNSKLLNVWCQVAVICAVNSAVAFASVTLGPNDTLFARQWSLNNDGTQTVSIDVDDLHTVEQKGKPGVDIGYLAALKDVQSLARSPVKVAVIDFGVDPAQPDLVGRISADGWNFVDNNNKMYDEDGHGTHVSGIIAANSNNRVGIAGITPNTVQVMPLKILANGYEHFSYNGQFISSYAAQAVRYATAHGASVINLSLGWPKLVDSDDTRAAFAEAVAKGVAIVVSAGNDKKDKPAYPCAYPDVICVGAISNTGAASVYSNSGGAVDILAPGDSIVSTYPVAVESDTLRIQGYEMLSGTSQASPHIAAIAAILRSINPAMSLDELKARLFVSAAATTQPGLALYGMGHLPEAIRASPQPVYAPDFKSIEGVTVDENSLQVGGQINVKNLWLASTNVQANLKVNGVLAGSATVGRLASGAFLAIPWRYQFASLDDSSELNIEVSVTDQSGKISVFSMVAAAARAMELVSEKSVMEIPTAVARANDWMNVDQFGHRFARLSSVATYGADTGMPLYFRTTAQDATGVSIQIFDTAEPNTLVASQLKIPYITRITQVMRVDLNRSGKLDWVVTGIGTDATTKKTFFQFYYLGPDLKPLFAKGSAWQILPSDDTQSKNIPHLYSKPDSWILGKNNRLIPSYIASGPLPDPDNFDSLDPRQKATGNHIYYIDVDPTQPAKDARQVAVLRAVDNATFYTQHPYGKIMTPMLQSPTDLKAGRITAMFAEGEDLGSTMSLLTASSVRGVSLSLKPDWTLDRSVGLMIPTIAVDNSSKSAVILSFTDSGRGSLSWTQAGGAFLGQTPFSFKQPLDPVQGMIGAFDLGGDNRFWFLESRFHLIGFQQVKNGLAKMQTIEIERDSSFPGEEFDELMQTVIVGTAADPKPGVFIDSTLVRGDEMSVVTWNQSTEKMERSLRYSLRLPSNCLQMTPIRVTSDPSSFTIPLICNDRGAAQIRMVRPEER